MVLFHASGSFGGIHGTYNAKRTGAAVTGDDIAGFDPGDLFEARVCGFGVQSCPDILIHVRRVDEVHMILPEIVLGGKFLQQNGSHLAELAPVLLSGNESAVDDLNARMQMQQVADKCHRIAAPAAGSEIIQVIGKEAHLGLLADCHGSSCGFIHSGVRMLCQPLLNGNDNGALADRNVLGVHNADILCILYFRFGLKGSIEEVGITSSLEKEMLRSAVTAVSHIVYLNRCFQVLSDQKSET